MPDDRSNKWAVIWDVDGTLVDTAALHFAAWERLANELNRPFSRDDFTATFGRRNPEILNYLFGTQFDDRRVAELGDRKEEYYKNAAKAEGVSLLPGARTLLEGLHQAGFQQAIGSSAPLGNLNLILGLTDTRQFFEAIVSMEDTQRGKPDPQVFQVAASRLAVSPAQCVVMEDAVAGVQAAKAGMRCIAVRFVAHHSEEKLRDAGADVIVDSLEKLTVPIVRALLS
jgi:beta-phosphoglucomutase